MKIVAVEAVPLGIPWKPTDPPSAWTARLGKQVLVRITTDEGLVGWGEAFALGAPMAVCAVVHERSGRSSAASLRPTSSGSRPCAPGDAPVRPPRPRHVRDSGVELALWNSPGRRAACRSTSSSAAWSSPGSGRTRASRGSTGPPTWPRRGRGRRRGVPRREAPPDRPRLGGGGPGGGGAGRGPHARRQLSLDSGGGDPHGPGARPLRPGVARGAGLAAGGLSGARPGPGGARHPIAAGENEATAIGFREMLRAGAADILSPARRRSAGWARRGRSRPWPPPGTWPSCPTRSSSGRVWPRRSTWPRPRRAWPGWSGPWAGWPRRFSRRRSVRTRARSRRPRSPGWRPAERGRARRPSSRRRADARLHDRVGADSRRCSGWRWSGSATWRARSISRSSGACRAWRWWGWWTPIPRRSRGRGPSPGSARGSCHSRPCWPPRAPTGRWS